MKKRIALIFILLAIHATVAQSPQAGSEGIGDTQFENLGNGGYDAQHYTLDLTWQPVEQMLSGTVTMTALATQDLSEFNLDFANFDVDEITVNNEVAEFEYMTGELTIVPDSFLSAGESFTTSITYNGTPADGWNITQTGNVYVVSEPDLAHEWYPVNDHPLDKATYTFQITVPKPLVVAANGILQEEIDNGETTTYIWQSDDPIASYLTTVNIGEYVIDTAETADGILIRNYYPSDNPEEYQRFTLLMIEMMDFFTEYFGEFPFDVYGIVIAPADFENALEAQTMNVIGETLAFDVVIAHELAHEWFGNSVSLVQWQELWLKEGIAVFAEVLW
jgi:aminopeptidase N